jgi:hypothetical protein
MDELHPEGGLATRAPGVALSLAEGGLADEMLDHEAAVVQQRRRRPEEHQPEQPGLEYHVAVVEAPVAGEDSHPLRGVRNGLTDVVAGASHALGAGDDELEEKMGVLQVEVHKVLGA